MGKTVMLSQVKKGQSVVVKYIDGDELKSKLLELGITTGCKLRYLYAAPFGDPMAVDIDGFVLSLRKSEAQLIHVEAANL